MRRTIIDRKHAEVSRRNTRHELEQKAQERTAELSQIVGKLTAEVARRIRAEEALREQSQQLRMLAAELTSAEQRERHRIAEVLHGDFQQLLVGAKLILSPLAQAEDPAARQACREATELILQAIQCSRSLTEELSPPILHTGGLLPALEWLARWMGEKHSLAVAVQTDGTAKLESHDTTILLFQAIRELLFNIVKHAHVQTARVEISRQNGHVQVIVSDAGVGFDPAQLRAVGPRSGGFGLFSIRERLELLGGRLEIESAPGRGSRFTLLAPLDSADGPNRDHLAELPRPADQGNAAADTPTRLRPECPGDVKQRVHCASRESSERQGPPAASPRPPTRRPGDGLPLPARCRPIGPP